MPISSKEAAFVEYYLSCWNGAEAARKAGYSEHTAKEQASRLLTKVNVQEAIAARLAELKMSADEVLTRLSDHARGSLAPFMRTTGDGDFRGFDLNPDQPLHLIRRASSSKRTYKDESFEHTVTIELYDAQSALALLGKHHGLFVDRSEVSGPGGQPIAIQAYDYNTAVAPITGGSDEDSDPSGEDASTSDGAALGQVDDGRGD